jgi:O-Antigen ligase
MSPSRLDTLFLATLAVLTFEKIRWETPAATVTLTNLLGLAFVIAFAIDRARRRDLALPAASVTLLGFMALFLAIYLAGFFDLQNREAVSFWAKGVASWIAHFAFLVCGVAHMARRGRPLFVRAIRWFTAGLVMNCVYGLVQITAQVAAGINLDKVVVGRLTAGQGPTHGLNVFGKVAGTQTIYRVNALSGDPNHLGVMLCVPLLAFLPYYLREPRRRRRLGLLLLAMLGVQMLTLSRSAALGDLTGLIVLAPVLRRLLPSPRTMAIILGALAVVFLAAFEGSLFVRTVIETRLSLGGSSTSEHIYFYQLIPPALNPHPLFGMGFNTFAVYYQFLTGRTDFGAHSVWVSTLVETGIVGLSAYVAYIAYLIANAARIRLAGDPDTSRLGFGLTAAIVGTAAANFFYLTMTFDYFFAVALLAVSGAMLFAPVTQSPPLTATAGVGVRRA